MGASIRRDLRKKIPTLNDEKKIAAALRDPIIDIDCTGRQLGEEGLKLVCEALVEVNRCGIFKIEEINLSGNELTAASLKHMEEVIRRNPEIRDLDLSRNRIAIENNEDQRAWSSFLVSFHLSHYMRRLDLSENPLGDYGLEIFLRIYSFEPAIFLPIAGANQADDIDIEHSFGSENDREGSVLVSQTGSARRRSSQIVVHVPNSAFHHRRYIYAS